VPSEIPPDADALEEQRHRAENMRSRTESNGRWIRRGRTMAIILGLAFSVASGICALALDDQDYKKAGGFIAVGTALVTSAAAILTSKKEAKQFGLSNGWRQQVADVDALSRYVATPDADRTTVMKEWNRMRRVRSSLEKDELEQGEHDSAGTT
jgi:hypothetical protein